MSANVDINLNAKITVKEVNSAILKLKANKAVGPDNIKNEILKEINMLPVITKLFNYCFEASLVPTIWRRGIIHPIPKSGMKNCYLPLSYCGLTLLCTLEKTYTSVLST